MKTQTPTPRMALPLTRGAIKPNHSLRAQADRLSRLALDQELTGSFANIEMIEDALRELNAGYMLVLREYGRAVEMEEKFGDASVSPKTRA